MRFRLLPQEESFYRLFREQADLVQQSTALLLRQSRSTNGVREQYAERIAELERRGDSVVHDIARRVNKTMITPIDPEDIFALGSSLDDVLDGIEDVSYRLFAYHPRTRADHVTGICELLERCGRRIPEGIAVLEHQQPVDEVCLDIGRWEGQVDEVVRTGVKDLMAAESDALEIIKLKEVFDYLEGTADRCQDVADLLEDVVVKNS